MDDPWVPQYAAAGILEDLGQHGIVGDAGFAKPFLELGYWPPRSGPRIKGFEKRSRRSSPCRRSATCRR